MKTTILAFFLSAPFALAGNPISFRQLPAGESIHVTFTSTGCFHRVTYEFDFQRAATLTAKVAEIEDRWNEATKRRQNPKRIPLGTATLSEAQVTGLDRLFAFYRSNKPGGCTTVDQITATQRNGTTVKARESFTDRTCATYDMKNLTLLPSLAARFKPKTK